MYNTHINSRDLIKELKKAGWTVVRVKGSHNQLSNPKYNHVVTVPHPKKDLSKSLVKAIRKQAHLE